MSLQYPYLNDPTFLKQFDKLRIKKQYIKLNVLTFSDEKRVTEIEGQTLSGNITIDGSSAMRRTINLTCLVRDDKYNNKDMKKILTLNKKIEVLVGFENSTNKYTDFPILWFPQGIYVIMSSAITHDSNGISISLTLHDKMALLNGECGGTLPASVVFHEVEDVDEKGNIVINKPTIYQIIQELVNHFGGEQLGKIIISDLDTRIKQVMKWIGTTPLYCIMDGNNKIINFSTMQPSGSNYKMYSYGEDVGYIKTDFVYPGELVGKAGDTVVTILDQIKNVLGNYEYFYDVHGNFVFQEIKNYLNTSHTTNLIEEIKSSDYLVDYTNGKSAYTFENSDIIQSYSNTPQLQSIKNDFIVWGKRKTYQGNEVPIRYHLAIDKKPTYSSNESYNVFFYTDPDDGVEKVKKPKQVGSISEGYKDDYVLFEGKIYKWNIETAIYDKTDYSIESVTVADYRTKLLLQGTNAEPFGTESNYYYPELKNEWTKIYDLRNPNPKFKAEALKNPSEIDYFLDFIDTDSSLSDFSVENIGRRTSVIVDDTINCVFQPDIPDVVIIESGTKDTEAIRTQCIAQGLNFYQVNSDIYSLLAIGGSLKSAYEQIRKELYQYTNYNEQISLTTLPIYYLEPNLRITVQDAESGISGDYMIKSLSLPLGIDEMMNLSCVRITERI